MSVTAAKGFSAAGVVAGLKSSGKRDLALVHNRGPLTAAAAVFTTNRCKANPVLWSEQVIADGVVSRSWAPISPKTGRLDAFEWAPPSDAPSGATTDGRPDIPAAFLQPAPTIAVSPPSSPAEAPL